MNIFRPPQPYVNKPKKVEDSPLSPGFEQKDYKDKEETEDLAFATTGELIMAMFLSSIGLIASTALTIHRYYNGEEWKLMTLMGFISCAYLVATIKEYYDPTN